jgi:hypothetical protein
MPQPAKPTITIVADPPNLNKRNIKEQLVPKNEPSILPPQQLVKFYTSEVSIGVKYHEVIIKGISLVLAFDKRYTAATVPEFSLTEDGKTFKIVVDGYPYILSCLYYGQHFEHNDYVYTLFVIFDTEDLNATTQHDKGRDDEGGADSV